MTSSAGYFVQGWHWQMSRSYLGVVTDIVPPGRVKHVVTLHDLLEHLSLVVRVERLVTAETATGTFTHTQTHTPHCVSFLHCLTDNCSVSRRISALRCWKVGPVSLSSGWFCLVFLALSFTCTRAGEWRIKVLTVCTLWRRRSTCRPRYRTCDLSAPPDLQQCHPHADTVFNGQHVIDALNHLLNYYLLTSAISSQLTSSLSAAAAQQHRYQYR